MGKDKKRNLAANKIRAQSNNVFRLVVLCAIAIAVVGYGMVYFIGQYGQVHYLHMDPTGVEKLKEVFFSGEPWLIQCVSDEIPLHPAAIYAARNLYSSGVRVGSLRCLDQFPSGKNFFQRFSFPDTQLQDKDHPLFFLFANQDHPFRPKGNDLRNASTIVQFAARDSEPRVHAIRSTNDFNTHCGRRKACVLLVAPGDVNVESFDWVAKKHRNARIAKVNSVDFALSFAGDVKLAEKLKDVKEPAIVVLKNAQTEEDIQKMKEYKEQVANAKKQKGSEVKLTPPPKPYGVHVASGSSDRVLEAVINSHVIPTTLAKGGDWISVNDAKVESLKRAETAAERARRQRRDKARELHHSQREGRSEEVRSRDEDEGEKQEEKKEIGDELDLEDDDVIVDDE